MKVFLVERVKDITWCEDYAMVIVADDALHAERLARWSSYDFEKGDLSVKEINLCRESCVLIANTGA